MHVAESKVQAVVGPRKYGTTLVGHLHKLGLIGPNFTAAHAVWIDDDDMGRLADAGACVAHNPGSNMKLGSGLGAARKMRDRGITLGIGTDGCLSSDNQNVFEAMRTAAFISRVQGPDPRQWLTAAEAFEAATKGGARALGMENSIGQLAPGFKADVVFLDLTNINYVPLNEPLLHVVFVEDGTGVDRVMVGGRMLVEGGKVLGVDMVKLAAEANAAAEHLVKVNAGGEATSCSSSSRWCSTIASASRASPTMCSAGASTRIESLMLDRDMLQTAQQDPPNGARALSKPTRRIPTRNRRTAPTAAARSIARCVMPSSSRRWSRGPSCRKTTILPPTATRSTDRNAHSSPQGDIAPPEPVVSTAGLLDVICVSFAE